MIKLSKLTDYAIVVLVELSKDNSGMARSASYLADKTGITEPAVAKVLKQLAREALVESMRGASGGYKAVRPADQMSLAEVITAMDGPIAIVSCLEEGEDQGCSARARCPVTSKWDHVNTQIRQTLENIKLSDMVAPSCSAKLFNLVPSPQLRAVAEA